MELREYIGILTRRKWVVIFTLLFTLAVVVIGVLQTPPLYTASTQIRVLTTKTGGATYVDYNVEYAERLKSTYVRITTSTPVLDELSKHVEIPTDDLLEMITVESISNTELFQISVESKDPGLSQYMANKLAQIVINQSKLLYSDDVNPVNIYVIEPAAVPDIPSSPSPFLIIGLGFVAGVIGGVGLALLFENLDTRLYTSSQIEALTHLKAIGDIPEERGYNEEEGLLVETNRLQMEAFRRLRTNIFSPFNEEQIKTLLVTSSVTQDGKSSMTVNLGLSIAQTEKKVLIIDANLRWPRIHKILRLNNEVGLSDLLNRRLDDVLKQGLHIEGIIQPTSHPGLFALTSGAVLSNPVELLASPRTKAILDHYKTQFDVIIIDSPACLSVTDPVVLATKVEGVLIVVRHGWVRREVLMNSIRQLNDANANIIGFVANRTGMGVSSRYKKN